MLARGVESHVLAARLQFMDVEGVARYVRGMTDVSRIYPRMLPTQADGRFSTSEPPLPNFPAWLRGGTKLGLDGKPYTPPPLIIPDDGWFWVSHDWSALHARIAVAYTHDPVDKEAFANGWDIHTLTACGMWRHALPRTRTKGLHTDDLCAGWRVSWAPPWAGEDDRRRRLAKIMRYATLLGRDERAALESKDVEKEGLTRAETLAFAKQYLDSKPHLVAGKQRQFTECAEKGVSYTFMGRRRLLQGDWWTRAKEGWAHKLQGAEADMMATYLIAAVGERGRFQEAHLVLNTHDGAILAFPESHDPHEVRDALAVLAERTWVIEGIPVHTPADWKQWLPDGTLHKL